MINIGQLILSCLVSVGLSGLLIWLTKTWISERLKLSIKDEYDQKLETHKAQLQAQSDVAIEKLRAELNIIAKEHEVRFSKLHDKRAQVIAKTYSLLKTLFLLLRDLTKSMTFVGEPTQSESYNLAVKIHKEFHDYYSTHLIFLPKETSGKLEDINAKLVTNFNKFAIQVLASSATNAHAIWDEIADVVKNEIPKTLEALEDEFRELLGGKNDLDFSASMTDIQFYHLTSTPLERALPKLLEKAVQGGFKVLVQLESEEKAEAISAHLWTYDPASFLAHGTAKDGLAEQQPIYLTAKAENPNQADLLVVTDGSELEPDKSFKRVLDIFDGTDEAVVASARSRWKKYQGAGHAVAYIKQSITGAWEKQSA